MRLRGRSLSEPRVRFLLVWLRRQCRGSLGPLLERVRAALPEAEERLRPSGVSGGARGGGCARRGRRVAEEVGGSRRTVPHCQEAAEPRCCRVDYAALMAAALEAGIDGLGARRAAVVLGWNSASAFWHPGSGFPLAR